MKKFLILVTVTVMAVCLMAGCAGEVKTYTDSGQTISIRVNQEFAIALGSNPTTGYDWQVSYEENMLRLVESKYEAGEEAKQGMVGAGGVKYFRFRALGKGDTEITLTYKRQWEEEFLEQKVFEVNVK
jgi:inhibitor of cysteine peptidase